MKLFVNTVIITLLMILQLNAQTVDGAFNHSISPPTFSVTISVNMQSGTGSAGVVAIEFTFNTGALSIPMSLTDGVDYSLIGNFSSYTTKNITRPAADKIRISLLALSGAVSLSTTPTDIITLNFTVTDPGGSPDLVWTQTDIAPGFLQPNYAAGSWPPLTGLGLLPVELSSFSADVADENDVELLWETKTELNNYGFDIERLRSSEFASSDWEKIGFVDGAGNSNSPKNYSFTDKNLTGGTKFSYRLKQIDNDGTFEYSDVVEVEIIPEKFMLYQNYPNPFNPSTKIKFNLPEAAGVNLSVYNALGQFVMNIVDEKMEAGYFEYTFDGSNLSSGVYIFRLTAGNNFTSVKKMLMLK